MSRFMITAGTVLLLVSALMSTDYKQSFNRFLSNKSFWSTIGIFLIMLISGIYTEHWNHLLPLLRLSLPLLVMAFAFGMLPSFSEVFFSRILFFLICAMSMASLWVLVNYFQNFDLYQKNLSVSKAIITPQNDHIRFSLLLCLSIFSGFWLLKSKDCKEYKIVRFALILTTIFLILTLHVLSVRSGLLAFYFGIIVYVVQIFLIQRKIIAGIVLLILILAAPYIAFQTMPSFRQKYYLMKYNWEQYQKGNIGNLSDTQRILSYQIAFRVAAQQPWIGVGMGDLAAEQEKIYKNEYPELEMMQPHNQFISYYAGTGIIGLILFILCFFFPLFHRRQYKNEWFLMFYCIVFSSFLTENTIFTSVGTTFYCFFLLLFTNVFQVKFKS